MITGIFSVRASALSRASTSTPFRSGIIKSSNITSKGSESASANASRPPPALVTVWCRVCGEQVALKLHTTAIRRQITLFSTRL